MNEMTLAILAGGKSSRMNYHNKALLNYKEKKFIEYLIEAGDGFKEIVISANNNQEYKQFGLPVINDIYPDNGPLSGIHAVLNSATTEKVLCVACDMPLITKETLNYLAGIKEEHEVIIPKVNDRLQPLCAVYSKSIIDKLEAALRNNDNKMQKLIRSLDYFIVNEDKFKLREFSNINTPDDYKKMEGNK